MKAVRLKSLALPVIFLIIIICSAISSGCSPAPPPGGERTGGLRTDPFLDAGCTVIYASDGEAAFGGNNEDSPYPDTMVWFLPPEEGKFGRALFGYEGFIWQGGVNDQGLFFDALVGNEKIQVDQGEKARYPGSLPGKALAECADVGCVKRLFREYHAYDDWNFQFMFGDASGSSVIIEPETMLDGGAPFQVATNFYQSRTNLNQCRFCERYWTARNLFEKDNPLSVELFRDILDEVHLENETPTQYSTVYDLNNGLIYLYHFHNYAREIVFDLEQELSQGYQVYRLVDLFPENPEFQAWAQPELERLEEARADYSPVELDPAVVEPYLGDFVGPDDYNMLFDYYSIALEHGRLVLKMLPDKAWLELVPVSETTFYHVSSSSEFEITFHPEENGEVNRFTYRYLERDIPFQRVDPDQREEIQVQLDEGPEDSSRLSALLFRIGHFFGTNTFKLLAIVLGLILLQSLLGYLRSLLI